MGWDFLDHQTCKGLAKDRSILVDIVDIRTEKIGRPRRDSCCCEMRTFYNEVYSIETLLRITCQIISEYADSGKNRKLHGSEAEGPFGLRGAWR